MRIVDTHSHFNGLEYLLVHKKDLRDEIGRIIEQASPIGIESGPESNEVEAAKQFKSLFKSRGWSESELSSLIKDRVALNFQDGKYAFSKHLAFYVRDEIDVGIEILAMKSLQQDMSSGPAYYEGELYNVIRNRRGMPAVPLVMIGVAP